MRRQHLLVGLVFCLSAVTYSGPGATQPFGPDGHGGNVSILGGGGAQRFTVEALHFIVHNETGSDWLGSDEVVFIIRTPNYSLLSSLYGNIDSGLDQYRFKRCIQPAVDGDSHYDHEWECDEKGMAPPFHSRLPPMNGTAVL